MPTQSAVPGLRPEASPPCSKASCSFPPLVFGSLGWPLLGGRDLVPHEQAGQPQGTLSLSGFVQHKKAVGVGSAEAGILEQKLRLVISDFHQLVLAFLQVYDKELSECCNLDCPFIHPLGPIVETVCRTLISCRKVRITLSSPTVGPSQGP